MFNERAPTWRGKDIGIHVDLPSTSRATPIGCACLPLATSVGKQAEYVVALGWQGHACRQGWLNPILFSIHLVEYFYWLAHAPAREVWLCPSRCRLSRHWWMEAMFPVCPLWRNKTKLNFDRIVFNSLSLAEFPFSIFNLKGDSEIQRTTLLHCVLEICHHRHGF